jgi:hypothetical protein
MKQFFIALGVIGMLGTIASCKKDKNNNNNNAGSYTSLKQALSTVAPAPKTVTIDAATGGSFYGNSGTRYVFPANAFLDGNNTLVTGNVQITATEYLNKSSMIFSNVTPYTTSGSLYSGGEINVTATQNGNTLHMNYMTFQANMPQAGTPVAGMSLFLGTVTDTAVVWNLPKTNHDSVQSTIVYNGDTIAILSDSLNYCNADQFLTNPDYQTFTVVPSIPGVTINDTADLRCFAAYDNYNGVWRMNRLQNGKINEGHVPNIPVHFIVFAVINGNFYAGTLGTTPANGSTYSVVLSLTTPAIFKAQVEQL